MYILLGGIPPFYGDTEEEIFDKIKKCKYDFSPLPFKKVSKNCKDLIRKLLEPNKKYRITANDALKHPFFTESFDPNSAMTENKDLNILKKFITPSNYASKFHEAICAYLCLNFLPPEEENSLRTVFRYLDKDDKGIITEESIKKCLEEIDVEVSNEELKKIFDKIDENGSGLIEYQEFVRNAYDVKLLMTEGNLKNVFITVCGDKDFMTAEDMKKFIFQDDVIPEQTLNDYYNQIGVTTEDKITFEDFSNMIKNNCKLRGGKDLKLKLKDSKYAFKGQAIEEKEEEDGNLSPRKKNEEDEENGGVKENGEIKINGIANEQEKKDE